MDKLLSSIFCCSIRSKDDGNDKIQQRTTTSVTSNRPTPPPPLSSGTNQNKNTTTSNKHPTTVTSTSATTSTESSATGDRNLRTNPDGSENHPNTTHPNNDNNPREIVEHDEDVEEDDEDEEDDDDILKGKQRISSKKELLDDAHSETDTITNTNEESNSTSKLQQQGQEQQQEIQNQSREISNDIITTANPENTSNSVNNTKLTELEIAQLSELSVEEHDETSSKVATKIPEQIVVTKPPQIIATGETDEEYDDELDEDDEDEDEEDEVDEDDESYLDLTKLQEGQAYNPETGYLLGHKDKNFAGKKCLILDLDETLVHSSFKYLRTADFVIPVEIDNQIHHVYVIKRPGVDEFLKKVGQWYEVVVFTASVLKYGDPLLDKLDLHQSVHHRLFRDSCYNYQGNFIKNLSQVGRPLRDTIIIDNSPASYIFHPQHSIPISSWFSDTHDNELLDLLPLLEDLAKSNVDDVGLVLDITL